MSRLIVRDGASVRELAFEGQPLVGDLLLAGGIAFARPCGGRGVCGKCRMPMRGSLSGKTLPESEEEPRLACRTRLLGDAEVTLPDARAMAQIEMEGAGEPLASQREGRLGAAVDIGTTTLAVRLYDLRTGERLGEKGILNPQTAVAADVIGRIEAAMGGRLGLLRDQIRGAISSLLGELCAEAGVSPDTVDAMTVTGNTTMLYLYTGRDPTSLSHAPFEADCLFGSELRENGCAVYLPPCMNAFVGADITCAAAVSGMCGKSEVSLLCDLGTNGEIALWKNGTLSVTSTAAGPAFEGAGISCGCGSVPGAIDRVSAVNGALEVHTIGDLPAVGVCGSGLIDSVAAFLDLEILDETGAVDDDSLPLSGGVALLPADIRAVQLAKAAIAAGILTLLEETHTAPDEIKTFYIAGGFGAHLNAESAVRIGLFPRVLAPRIRVLGNAALSGASACLLQPGFQAGCERIAAQSRHVSLGGNPRFNNNYMERMLLEEIEDDL